MPPPSRDCIPWWSTQPLCFFNPPIRMRIKINSPRDRNHRMNLANRGENKNQYSTWSTYVIKSARRWGNPRPAKPSRPLLKATLAPSIAPRNTPAPSPDPPNLRDKIAISHQQTASWYPIRIRRTGAYPKQRYPAPNSKGSGKSEPEPKIPANNGGQSGW